MSLHRRSPVTLTILVLGIGVGLQTGVCVTPLGQLVRANRGATILELRRLKDTVEKYQRQNKKLPASLEDLVPRYIDRIVPDPWGNAYLYTRSSETFEVRSAGPDKVPGTEDDVTIHTTM